MRTQFSLTESNTHIHIIIYEYYSSVSYVSRVLLIFIRTHIEQTKRIRFAHTRFETGKILLRVERNSEYDHSERSKLYSSDHWNHSPCSWDKHHRRCRRHLCSSLSRVDRPLDCNSIHWNVHDTERANVNKTKQTINLGFSAIQFSTANVKCVTNLTFFASITVGRCGLFVGLLIEQWTAFFTIYAACIVRTIAFNDLQRKQWGN